MASSTPVLTSPSLAADSGVATVARLKKRNLKKADKTPRTYDQKTFKLDGRMDLDIAFEGKTMCTPVYIKMDAADQLLQSEGVCRQLGVVTYHQKVEKWRGHSKKPSESPPTIPSAQEQSVVSLSEEEADPGAKVPTVRVSLVQSVYLLPHQSQVVEVSLDGQGDIKQPLLLSGSQLSCGVDVDTSLLDTTEDRVAYAVLSNTTGCSMAVDKGSCLRDALPVDVVQPQPDELLLGPGLSCPNREPDTTPVATPTAVTPAVVSQVEASTDAWHQKKLAEIIGPTDILNPTQRRELIDFLGEHHTAFALEELERGETDFVEFAIETGDAEPKRCVPRRMPFAVRKEVARQLKDYAGSTCHSAIQQPLGEPSCHGSQERW